MPTEQRYQSPAELASAQALDEVYAAIESGRSFILEAGAGAGKTYSLVKALHYLINSRGATFVRHGQQVACITYTNVASDEIKARTDGHPAVCSSTIHAFCWTVISRFQSYMRSELLSVGNWRDRVAQNVPIGNQSVQYNLGHPKIDSKTIQLHHNDVLAFTAKLLELPKFRRLLTSTFPIIFIDEYQDTDAGLATAIKNHILGDTESPLIGFFGDHWQRIYGSTCGSVDHPSLRIIGKRANFRSAPEIVQSLNRMRPELPQEVSKTNAIGEVRVYHTNDWTGTRRTGQHWAEDLPAPVAHQALATVLQLLASDGWDTSSQSTKVLMLTHNVLAQEQGYGTLASVFQGYNEGYAKKEDKHIAFFLDLLEPACLGYAAKDFGSMLGSFGLSKSPITSIKDKRLWTESMERLLSLRLSGTIGDVLDHLRETERPCLTEDLLRLGEELTAQSAGATEGATATAAEDERPDLSRLRSLRQVLYSEVMALARFIDDKTPFSTKHGVKGAEFENVLVVFGRGWNQYNFNQFLEWAGGTIPVPTDRVPAFERNRNLFYVACSRPRTRLALLFTQKLSIAAMDTLASWFREDSIRPLSLTNPL